jgi:hypothetical protein
LVELLDGGILSVIAEDLHQYKYGYTVNEPGENRVESDELLGNARRSNPGGASPFQGAGLADLRSALAGEINIPPFDGSVV